MPQAPTVTSPPRLPLVIEPENRGSSTNKDAKLVNCYVEKQKDGTYWIFKRAGILQSSRPPGASAAGAGMFNWLGNVYAVFGAVLYKNGVSVGAVNAAGGVYRFDSCLGATPKLVLGNGIKAYTYDAGAGLVEITDGQFPSAFVKGWAYLDGTTYVARADAGIQGSDLNDPQNWDVLNVIVAQIEPDRGVALAKQLVYVVIFKQWSTEIFYDAANATGSPLATVQGAKVNHGCANGDSVQSIDGILIWASTNQSASAEIMKMEGLKADTISTAPVERLLDPVDFTQTIYSFQFKDNGHRFYIITSPSSNLTLCYDLDQKMWYQITDKDGNYWPFVATTYDSTTLRHYFQHESNGRIYLANSTYYTDDGDQITVEVVTPNFDGEVDRRKQCNRMTFLADVVAGSEMEVRINDKDYAADAWSQWRKVDLSTELPFSQHWGTFVRRATHLRHSKPTAFRLKAINLQLDIGTL